MAPQTNQAGPLPAPTTIGPFTLSGQYRVLSQALTVPGAPIPFFSGRLTG